MSKKLLAISFIGLLIIAGGLFYWQNNHQSNVDNQVYGQIQPEDTYIDYKPIECFFEKEGELFYNNSCD